MLEDGDRLRQGRRLHADDRRTTCATQVEALKRAGADAAACSTCAARPGARPPTASKVAEIFLQGGPVAKLVGRRADEQLLQADAARSAWTGPLAVLVDNGTAGPGEIVAAALLDAGRAKLVGEHTFGRAGGDEDRAAARGRPRADRREVRVAEGHRDPRRGPHAHGAGGERSARRTRTCRRARRSRTASSTRRSRSLKARARRPRRPRPDAARRPPSATERLQALAGAKRGQRRPGTRIGLRPCAGCGRRARLRRLTRNVPKSTSLTGSPLPQRPRDLRRGRRPARAARRPS